MDWRRLCEENNIHFVDRGPNTKRGEISIQCPMCGSEDPSEHLGINLETGFWGCHRDASHRGKSPRTLVKAILGCSSQQAELIIRQYSHSDPDSLKSALEALEPTENIMEQAQAQKLEPQWNNFYKIKRRGITNRFFQYLVDRGYENAHTIITEYDLRCAMTGRYKDRIIIPVKQNGELLGWTSRAIGALKDAPRYLASSEDVKTTVWNYDELKKGGDRLFITEGPFDAIRIDSYQLASVEGLTFRATCTFGTSVSVSQYALLRSLMKHYKETYVLFDIGAEGPAQNLAEWTGAKVATLPSTVYDPGELSPAQIAQFGDVSYNGWVTSWKVDSNLRKIFRWRSVTS